MAFMFLLYLSDYFNVIFQIQDVVAIRHNASNSDQVSSTLLFLGGKERRMDQRFICAVKKTDYMAGCLCEHIT